MPRDLDQEILPLAYDTDDEDDEDEDANEDENENMLMDEENEGINDDSNDDIWEDINDVNEGWGSIFGTSGLEQEGETAEEFARWEYEGEQILDGLQVFMRQLTLITDVITDASKYPPSHRHLKEISKSSIHNFSAMMEWAKRVDADRKVRKVSITWNRKNRGVMFR